MSRAADFWMKINGVLMPTPVTCPITEYDMQSADSGRDEAALMHITQVPGLGSSDTGGGGQAAKRDRAAFVFRRGSLSRNDYTLSGV